MYGWIWRKLPGGRLAKYLQLILLITAVVMVLFVFVFPNLENVLTENPTLGQ